MKKLGLICFIMAVFAFCISFKAVNSFAMCGACDVDEELAKVGSGETSATAQLYKKHCEICHGYNGKGQTFLGKGLNARDFTDAKWEASVTDEQMIKQIEEGTQNLKPGEETRMFGFKEKLTPDEIKALVKFVRGFAKK